MGMGGVIAKFFDPKKVSVENWGKPGKQCPEFYEYRTLG